jgi:hypothetical protein
VGSLLSGATVELLEIAGGWRGGVLHVIVGGMEIHYFRTVLSTVKDPKMEVKRLDDHHCLESFLISVEGLFVLHDSVVHL